MSRTLPLDSRVRPPRSVVVTAAILSVWLGRVSKVDSRKAGGGDVDSAYELMSMGNDCSPNYASAFEPLADDLYNDADHGQLYFYCWETG